VEFLPQKSEQMEHKQKPYDFKHPIFDQLLEHLKLKKVLDRVKALESLARVDDPRVIHAVIKALSDKSPTMRSVAAELLGTMGKKEAITPLTKTLDDSNKEVRMMAARSLGTLLRGKSIPLALINHLKDSDELVRIEVCESLGAIGNRKALSPLWETIHDRSPLVRSYAAGAIGELGKKKDITRLEAELQKERSDTSRVGFYQALYNLGKTDAIVELFTLLQSPDYRVRCATAKVLSSVVADESNASIILRVLRKALQQEPTVAAKDSIKSSISIVRNQFKSR